MLMTFKALSALLAYPTRELQRATGEISEAIAGEGLLPAPAAAALEPLLAEVAGADIYDLEEAYVGLFDRSRTLSLNLFEHVHGESRDRGGAMVDLLETYHAAGFEPAGTDLPDHLPVLLEFLSTRPLAEARETLADAAHILAAIRIRLDRRGSPYAAVFVALAALAAAEPDSATLAGLVAEKDDHPNDLAKLDEVWEETAVTFGPDPNAGCPAAREVLARLEIPRGTLTWAGAAE